MSGQHTAAPAISPITSPEDGAQAPAKIPPAARSALHTANPHRHWRDARTHTLHDPPRWKIQHIGRYVLNGPPPPRHGLL